MSGHTPGPWTINDHAVGNMTDVCCADGLVASVSRWSCGIPGDRSENAANARLVAAAPDLLDACELAARHHQGMHSEVGSTLRAAIAKAKVGS